MSEFKPFQNVISSCCLHSICKETSHQRATNFQSNFDLQFLQLSLSFLSHSLPLSLLLSHSSVNSIAFCACIIVHDDCTCWECCVRVCVSVVELPDWKFFFFVLLQKSCQRLLLPAASYCCCQLSVASCQLPVASCCSKAFAMLVTRGCSGGVPPSWCSCHKPLNPLMDSLHNSHKWGWTQELGSSRSCRGGTLPLLLLLLLLQCLHNFLEQPQNLLLVSSGLARDFCDPLLASALSLCLASTT